jgi:hypothetical protein
MAHYAFIDDRNIVVNVIVGVDETVTQIDVDGTEVGGSTEAWEAFYQAQPWHKNLICKRTSYNGNYRKQFAAIGGTFDFANDVFILPTPFPSWVLDENFDWQPPTPMPIDGKKYVWLEANQQWIEFTQQ